MRRAIPFLAVLTLALVAAPGALGAQRTFEGTCAIAGPIEPEEPINAIPRLGARFSFHGRGACDGVIGGKPRSELRARLDVDRAQTIFDSCELGPDLGIPVTLSIRRARHRWSRFPLTLHLARVATFGPFLLQGHGGGWAHGVAELIPADLNEALAACADPQGGITEAQLEAAFETAAPLVASRASAG